MTATQLKADEALRLGLANKVVPAAELLTAAKATATTMASKGPLAIGAVKRLLREGVRAVSRMPPMERGKELIALRIASRVTEAELAERLGIVVSPGEFYGPASLGWLRVAAVATDDALDLVASRAGL